MASTDPCHIPATELTRLIRTKAVSPAEVTRAVLARIERVNPTINAYCTIMAGTALDTAREAENTLVRRALLGPADRLARGASLRACLVTVIRRGCEGINCGMLSGSWPPSTTTPRS